MISIDKSKDFILVHLPADVPTLIPTIREIIPGVFWDSTNRVWKVPPTRRSTIALRHFLMNSDETLDLDKDVASQLTQIASSTPTPDAVVEDEMIVIRYEHAPKYDLIMHQVGAKGNNNAWYLPLDKAPSLKNAIEATSSDLLMSEEVKKLSVLPPPAIPSFDGTLESLKHVPLSVLKYMVTKRDKKKKTLPERFSSIGIDNLYDLIHLFPLRYIDRSSPKLIRDLDVGDMAAVLGKIDRVSPYDGKMTKVTIKDGAGDAFSVTYFRQPWIGSRYKAGEEVVVYGKYEPYHAKSGSVFPQFSSAQIDAVGGDKGSLPVVPVYPQSDKIGITTLDIVSSLQELFSRLTLITDTLPQKYSTYYDLCTRDNSYRHIHFPESSDSADNSRSRLVHEELLGLQIYIQQQRKDAQVQQAVPHVFKTSLRQQYVKSFPYELTGAQKRVISDIEEGITKDYPLHMLLQGDVGSGKSLCAFYTLLATVDAGYQGALMAPTEILAEQLYTDLKQAEKLGIRVEFLGSKTKAAAKRVILNDLKNGDINILVGTHAVIAEGVEFHDLGVAVIDEQHRFGAGQRTKLRNARKDDTVPHLLVMTATPIPRTGAMVVYGDLDLGILDEMPPGRVPITTQWIKEETGEVITDRNHPVWNDILDEVADGHQAYVVASLVEESEKIAAQSAEETYAILSQGGPLDSVRVGMVHGRQPRDERENIMKEFASGNIDVLVSTTVIEVGVNVPNATVMAVLDAGRFGIAQLHQIRGRVGRSSIPSRCYLIGDTNTETGRNRLNALVASTDGFYLSEKDLEIRGEGALFGDRQSGDSDLKIARLREDFAVLELAQENARKIINNNDYADFISEVNNSYASQDIQS